jgi:hypothetical protein
MKKTTIVYNHWMLKDLLYCIMLFKDLRVLANTHNDRRILWVAIQKEKTCA